MIESNRNSLRSTETMETLPWRNTNDRYGKLAMILHWTMALLFLGLYCSIYFRHWFTERKTDINWTALQTHMSLGVTMAVFVALRVAYKLWDKQPRDVPGSRLEHMASRGIHLALYAAMIVMPITGYISARANTEFFFLFDIPKFRETALYGLTVTEWLGIADFKAWAKPIHAIHATSGAWIVWPLILLHIAAAVFHHWVRKDTTLKRMLPGPRLVSDSHGG